MPTLNAIAGDKNVPCIKEISIGDWDMDATASVAVAHGLSATEWKTIRAISAVVRNDADTIYYDIHTQKLGEGEKNADSTNINLYRDPAGIFDNTNFDSTTYNRGWITLTYIPD